MIDLLEVVNEGSDIDGDTSPFAAIDPLHELNNNIKAILPLQPISSHAVRNHQ